MKPRRFWNNSQFYQFVLCLILGAFWMSAGLSKGVQLLFAHKATVSAIPVWTDQFPAFFVFGAVGCEILVACSLFFGPRRAGLTGGLLLLSIYSIALMAYPLDPTQSCGCGGAAHVADRMPLVRNAVLAGIHFVALSLLGPRIWHGARVRVLPDSHAAMP